MNTFILDQLNRIYCAKSHLVERIGDIIEDNDFIILRLDIQETIFVVEEELNRLQDLYAQLDTTYSFRYCVSLINALEDFFFYAQQPSSISQKNLSFFFYLKYIDNIQKASFETLKIVIEKSNEHPGWEFLNEYITNFKTSRKLHKKVKAVCLKKSYSA